MCMPACSNIPSTKQSWNLSQAFTAWGTSKVDVRVCNGSARAVCERWCSGTVSVVLRRSDNYIGGMGSIVLANALKQNKGLQELHIKGNDIGDAGITAICQALEGMGTVSPHVRPHPMSRLPNAPLPAGPPDLFPCLREMIASAAVGSSDRNGCLCARPTEPGSGVCHCSGLAPAPKAEGW